MDRIRLYECMARLGKLVESPERIRIVDALCQAERSVESLSEVAGLPVRTVSHHLQILKRDSFVVSRRSGRYVIYSVAGEEVVAFLERMKLLSENIYPEMTLSLRELREKRSLLDKTALPVNPMLIDVRPLEEYDQAHIPGAVSVPFLDFKENMKVIPEGTPVIAYCRDRFCDFADQAVEILKQNGYQAWRIEDSVSARMAEARPLVNRKENK
ncbi:MAG: metalloregulator ArsR/SmtB family transcription factor [Candidatus Sabulitectum sp.]|nr:metalloregulator ArsR/SmtB family transcription factor [Candidatus Sabulitectum sp.]